MKHDIRRMRENPGAVKRSDLIGAMRERGWALRRQGAEHEIWFKRGAGIVSVPRALKGLGTIRASSIRSSRGRSREMDVKEAQAIPYTRVVEPGEDGVFTARLVELPGAIAEGETSVDALASLERLLPDFFDVMIEEGLEFPPAMSRKAHSGEIKLRMTPAAHAHAELVASVEGVSINRVLSDAVAKYVGMRPADGVKRARLVAKGRSATPAPRRVGAGPAQPAAKKPASKSPAKRRPIARRVGGASPKA